ncbi:hypothetical protein [Fretibacterium fastidiosum]
MSQKEIKRIEVMELLPRAAEGFGQTTRLTDANRRPASCRSAEGEGSPGS